MGLDVNDSDDAEWLDLAVQLATASVSSGGGPFGAVIVGDGALVSTGQNRVTLDADPTAHAEVVAIRTACSTLGNPWLAGYTLYSSCEPCPLCVAATLWARLERVVYAADRDAAARGGFDDREFYELFDKPRFEWSMRVEQHSIPTANEPFEAWLAHEERAEY